MGFLILLYILFKVPVTVKRHPKADAKNDISYLTKRKMVLLASQFFVQSTKACSKTKKRLDNIRNALQ